MSGFEELRKTLFGDEQRRLRDLETRISQKELLAATLAPALPAAFRIAGREVDELAEAVRSPLIEATALAARSETYRYSEALAPIMGPAIRKGITSAMRAFLEQIDTVARNACSTQGISWRIESWRTGIPYDKIVLKHTLKYHVRDVFLIHRSSGLLLSQVQSHSAVGADHDAVAAMLTAIQDFVKDAIFTSGDDALHTINSGESTIWLCHGELALLACVIEGIPPVELRSEMQRVLDDLHVLHQQQFKSFVNNQNLPLDLADHLQPLLKSVRVDAAPRSGNPALTALVVGLLIGIPVTFQIKHRLEERRMVARLEQAFGSEPGYYLAAVVPADGRFLVRGLVDPQAPNKPEELLRKADLSADRVQLSLAPFLSLEPKLVQTRVEQAVRPPAEVRLQIDGRTLRLSGIANLAWKRQAEATTAALPYFDGIDVTGLKIREQETLAQVQEKINLTRLYFDERLNLAPDSERLQPALDDMVRGFVESAARLELQPCIRIVGRTDGLGGNGENARLGNRRVELIRARLTNLGLPASMLTGATVPADTVQGDQRLRRVDLAAQTVDKGKLCN